MTIDEGIQLCEYNAKTNEFLMKRCDDASGYTRSGNAEIRTTDAKTCEKRAEEHRQLAGWLRELKKLRETVKKYKDSYNKGFDDGVKALQANLELCAEEMEQEKLPGNVAKASKVLMKLMKERTCDDCISRQAVLDVLRTMYDTHIVELDNGDEYIDYNDTVYEIEQLPYVKPQQKIRHWISLDDFRGKYNENGFKCSECGEHSDYEENFCPNCGAKMVAQESEEV